MAVDLTNMAPMRIGTTTIPVESVTLDTGEMREEVRMSGLPFAGGLIVPQRMHQLRFRTFFKAAYDLVDGFKLKEFTVLEWYMRNYVNSLAGANGTQWKLKAGAVAVVEITGLSEGPGGVIMADMVAYLLSGGALDALDDIVEEAVNQTVLTVGAEPVYHVRGPVTIDGEGIDGVVGFSLDTGNRIMGNVPTDGRTYPESLIYDGGSRTISLQVQGIRAFLTKLKWSGSAMNVGGGTGAVGSVIAYLREIDRKGIAKDTGASITVGKGRVVAASAEQSVGSVDTGNILVHGINESLDQSDPFAVSFSATGI